MKMYTSKDHTFVICAYKESPYLRDCIASLKAQTVQSNIIIATGTPNEYIRGIASEFGLPLHVNEGETGIGQDWNYGYGASDTALVTIAHQDDVYDPDYLKTALASLNARKHPLIFFTDYGELREGVFVNNNTLLRVKRLLIFPMRIKFLSGFRFWKRRVLSLGDPICCPSVTFVKKSLPNPVFRTRFKCTLDWDTWERIANIKGEFVYSHRILMHHRIHTESETTKLLADNVRAKEDYQMFCRFWPKWIARLLIRQYVKSEKSNQV